MVIGQRLACIRDGVAKAGSHPKKFSRHEYDPRDTKGEADAGQNIEHNRRQDNLRHHMPGLGAQIAGNFEPGRIHLSQAGSGCKHHGPDRGNRNEKNNGAIPCREYNYRNRLPGERANHANQLKRRIAQFAEYLTAAKEDANRYPATDGDEQADTQTRAAGYHGSLDFTFSQQLRKRLERRNGPKVFKVRRIGIDLYKVASEPPKSEQDHKAGAPIEQDPPYRLRDG